jgi:hypothetical protein
MRARAPLDTTFYSRLVHYFVEGFLRYRSRLGAYAAYPGRWGGEGTAAERHHNRMEGFTRLAPLLAAWICGGRPQRLQLASGKQTDLSALLASGLSAGTDPASPEYWGDIGHHDSRIVEAADAALAVWLCRETLWREFPAEARDRILNWLAQVREKRTVDNNWHLFIVLVDCVIEALGGKTDLAERRRRYERAKSFYVGDGWFRDGPEGHFDYYNAWGFHYALDWMRRIAPDWDRTFLSDTGRAFARTYKYFFGPKGFPIMGRSICYRMAAPAPLVAAFRYAPDLVTAGEARRALDHVWSLFCRKGALVRGNVTQGYFATDYRILDSYSGPASCLWSLRSLVAALSNPDDSEFWLSAGEPLPVEKGDFQVDIPAVRWRVVGRKADGDVRLESLVSGLPFQVALEDVRLRDRFLNSILRRGRGPSNEAAKYGLAVYSSARPFCVDECDTASDD